MRLELDRNEGISMKRHLYIDGNTVYGIDEDCMRRKRENKKISCQEIKKEEENYLLLLLCMTYWEITNIL